MELPRKVENRKLFDVEANMSTNSICQQSCKKYFGSHGNFFWNEGFRGNALLGCHYAEILLILVFFPCSRSSKSLATDMVTTWAPCMSVTLEYMSLNNSDEPYVYLPIWIISGIEAGKIRID